MKVVPSTLLRGTLLGYELFVRARRLLEQRNQIRLAAVICMPATLAAAAAGRRVHLLLESANPLREH